MDKQYINTYDRLTINKYYELVDILNNVEANEYEKNTAILSVLTDIDEDDLMNLKLSEFNELMQNTAFLNKAPGNKIIASKYKIGDYTLIPQTDLSNITVTQFLDYQVYVKDVDKNLVNILSVFLIPEGKEYNKDYDINKVRDEIENNLSIVDAMSLSAFFLSLFKALLTAIQYSFRRKIKKMKKMKIIPEKEMEMIEKKMEMITALMRSGDGLV